MYTRRRFLGALGRPALGAAALALLPNEQTSALFDFIRDYPGDPERIAEDEWFWANVQKAFTVDRSIVNLNSGGVSPSPEMVQSAMKRHLDYSNEAPVYSMWRILEPQREGVRQRLARHFGVSSEEIALTRNASEGLEICQYGLDLEPGDEVLTTSQDYFRMVVTWKQRERREGIVLKQFDVPVPAEDPDEIVSLFEQHITPRTRVILMCHMINLTGQILPVKEVVQMARRKGIPVIVDGAHAFAHFAFNHADLDCDYYATSLHKWLYAPHGTGMLYVRQNKIKDLWPLMAAQETQDEDIRKFEEIGTHPAANYLAIGEALTFTQTIGMDRKEARLRHLRNYWAEQLLQHDRVRLHTSLDPRFSCGIACVEIDGVDVGELGSYMWRTHRIIVTPIRHDQFNGLRISPNVFTTTEELDRFVDAMTHVIKNGLPQS